MSLPTGNTDHRSQKDRQRKTSRALAEKQWGLQNKTDTSLACRMRSVTNLKRQVSMYRLHFFADSSITSSTLASSLWTIPMPLLQSLFRRTQTSFFNSESRNVFRWCAPYCEDASCLKLLSDSRDKMCAVLVAIVIYLIATCFHFDAKLGDHEISGPSLLVCYVEFKVKIERKIRGDSCQLITKVDDLLSQNGL